MSALVSLRVVSKALCGRLAFVPPLLSRLVIGVVFTHSGWGKLHNLDQVTSFFASLVLPFPELQAPFVASVELGCGALVLAGLATRLASIPLIGTMVVMRIVDFNRLDFERTSAYARGYPSSRLASAVQADSARLSVKTRRYTQLPMRPKLPSVNPPTWSEPGMCSRKLNWNSDAKEAVSATARNTEGRINHAK